MTHRSDDMALEADLQQLIATLRVDPGLRKTVASLCADPGLREPVASLCANADLRDIHGKLLVNGEVRKCVGDLLSIIGTDEVALRKADAAESQVIEKMRKLGRATLQGWATHEVKASEERALADSADKPKLTRNSKKNRR